VHLKDTVGHETSVFRSGEDFDITVKLTNISGKRLQFTRYNSAPDVLFRIPQGDSVVSYSTNGPFLMIVTIGYLIPGETMEGHWRGPSPMNRGPNVALPPGTYSLVISFRSSTKWKRKDCRQFNFRLSKAPGLMLPCFRFSASASGGRARSVISRLSPRHAHVIRVSLWQL